MFVRGTQTEIIMDANPTAYLIIYFYTKKKLNLSLLGSTKLLFNEFKFIKKH